MLLARLSASPTKCGKILLTEEREVESVSEKGFGESPHFSRLWYHKVRMEVVSNCVYEKRLAASLTQEELATALGVTRQTIISIEKGNYTPSVLLALKIATLFECSVEEIFSICLKK